MRRGRAEDDLRPQLYALALPRARAPSLPRCGGPGCGDLLEGGAEQQHALHEAEEDSRVAHQVVGLAAAGLAVCGVMNWLGVRSVTAYVLVGAGVWLATLRSSVHPTIAGVLLGLITPSRAFVGPTALRLSLTDDPALEAALGSRREELGITTRAEPDLSLSQELARSLAPERGPSLGLSLGF